MSKIKITNTQAKIWCSWFEKMSDKSTRNQVLDFLRIHFTKDEIEFIAKLLTEIPSVVTIELTESEQIKFQEEREKESKKFFSDLFDLTF